MSIFNRKKEKVATRIELITERGNGVYAWHGQLFNSDIIRSCLRPVAVAVGKTVPKHIYCSPDGGIKINPRPYIRYLLEEPNPMMSWQQYAEKMTRQRQLNGNAFAYLVRDQSGIPVQMYPLDATSVESIYDNSGCLGLKFYLTNGNIVTYPYTDIIHLRRDFLCNELFGATPDEALIPLLTIMGNIDKSIISAVKNSSLIRWLLKIQNSLRDEDIDKYVENFSNRYLSTSTNGTGVAAVDSKAEIVQVKTDDYVPNASIIGKTMQRLYEYFGENEKIIQSSYTENEWNAFYESEVEPPMIDFANELSRKIFTREERGFGNKIIVEASNLQYASMQTKLALCQMVDRGAMTPNEWRETLNKSPLPGGDEPIRRLDTAPISEGGESEE